MGKIYNIFSTKEASPTTHSVESARSLLPIVRKYTDEAVEKTDLLSEQLQNTKQKTPEFRALCKSYDDVVMKWAERIHRLGALAKGLWLVDFDTGDGYLCWSYPETKIEHFHSYDGGFRNRVRLASESRPEAK